MLEGEILSGSCSHSPCPTSEAVRSENDLEDSVDTCKNGRSEEVRGGRDFRSMKVKVYGTGFKFQLWHLLIMILEASHFCIICF